MIGKFITGGGFGHSNAYEHKLTVIQVEKAKVIYKFSFVPPSLPKKIKAKTYCQKN
jgi:hypothetical protein